MMGEGFFLILVGSDFNCTRVNNTNGMGLYRNTYAAIL